LENVFIETKVAENMYLTNNLIQEWLQWQIHQALCPPQKEHKL